MNRYRLTPFLAWTLMVCVTFALYGQGLPQCPPNTPECYTNLAPYTGRGPASALHPDVCINCAGDNRRVIVVRISSSWDTSPGNTNSNVFAAVECAILAWNNATESNGSKTGYHFVLDQQNKTQVPNADIVVNNLDLPGNTWAANDVNIANPTNPGLGEHLKTGHTCTLQNRPMESGRDESFYAFRSLLSTRF